MSRQDTMPSTRLWLSTQIKRDSCSGRTQQGDSEVSRCPRAVPHVKTQHTGTHVAGQEEADDVKDGVMLGTYGKRNGAPTLWPPATPRA